MSDDNDPRPDHYDTPSSGYWGKAALSSASSDVPYDHAATWVHNALTDKMEHAASDVFLAIDARHAGIEPVSAKGGLLISAALHRAALRVHTTR